jgi:NADH:ubiquinone oxidoreductase subunit F (NADH-binding)
MGTSLRSLIFDHAGGMKEGKIFRAAILGGAAGTFVDESVLDTGMDFDKIKEKGATLGSGAIIVMDDTMSIWDMLYSMLRFFEHESCGKCVPCRIGSHHLLVLMRQIKACSNGKENLANELLRQAELMEKTSLCPLGQSHILPVRSAIRYFPQLQ